MATTQIKTREEFRLDLIRRGISLAAWSRANGVKSSQVRDVLRKHTPCNSGCSHKIAVLMGIKDGIIDAS